MLVMFACAVGEKKMCFSKPSVCRSGIVVRAIVKIDGE